MKAITIVAALIALTFASAAGAEEKSKFITTWHYRVEYLGTNQVMEDSDPTQDGEVPLPSGSLLYCTRMKATVNNGTVYSGITCFSRGEPYITVSAIAECSTTRISSDLGNLMLQTRVEKKDPSHGKSHTVQFSVFCATKRVDLTTPTSAQL